MFTLGWPKGLFSPSTFQPLRCLRKPKRKEIATTTVLVSRKPNSDAVRHGKEPSLRSAAEAATPGWKETFFGIAIPRNAV